jgi:hypothetical protein
MNTLATKTPSAVAGAASPSGKNFNRRAFFAGGAATVLLIAAGIIVFGSLAAYVAFNGLPVGGGEETGDSVAVEAAGTGAPAGAAATLGAAPGAVAATAAAATAIAPVPAAGGDTPGTTAPPTDGTDPPGATPPGTTPTDTDPTPVPGGAGTGPGDGSADPVGGTVQGVENAAGGAGLDLPLSETIGPITGPADDAAQGTLEEVGGAVGQPDLGQQVGGAIDGLSNQLLPQD